MCAVCNKQTTLHMCLHETRACLSHHCATSLFNHCTIRHCCTSLYNTSLLYIILQYITVVHHYIVVCWVIKSFVLKTTCEDVFIPVLHRAHTKTCLCINHTPMCTYHTPMCTYHTPMCTFHTPMCTYHTPCSCRCLVQQLHRSQYVALVGFHYTPINHHLIEYKMSLWHRVCVLMDARTCVGADGCMHVYHNPLSGDIVSPFPTHHIA